jgi:hypothetical protein
MEERNWLRSQDELIGGKITLNLAMESSLPEAR